MSVPSDDRHRGRGHGRGSPVHADAAAAAEPLAIAAPLLYNRKRVCKMCVKFPISCWFSTWQITNRNANAFIATRNSRINAQPENIT